MEADKAARLPGVFPFSFCVPSSSPSTVFPQMPVFNAGWQQMCANFLQQQLLQLAHQQSPSLAPELSPSVSERASSREDSPSVKKLSLDESGCPLCPLCGDRLPENEWNNHVEMEKTRLLGVIQGIKSTKSVEISAEQPRRKRELELTRIRNNHMKRLALKRGIVGLRDSLTPFSRQSNEESGSSGSPEVKKEEDSFVGSMKCSVCTRHCEYGIVSSSFDSPRCQECFDQIRTLQTIIPPSLSSLPLLDLSRKRSPSPTSSASPPEKKPRVD